MMKILMAMLAALAAWFMVAGLSGCNNGQWKVEDGQYLGRPGVTVEAGLKYIGYLGLDGNMAAKGEASGDLPTPAPAAPVVPTSGEAPTPAPVARPDPG